MNKTTPASQDAARRGVSRRRFLRGATAAGVAAAVGPFVHTPARAANGKVVLISWGGNYRKAWEEAFLAPFTKDTGIEVVVADTPDLAKVKAQVTSGNIEWDVFDCPGSMALSGAKEGFWERLDTGIVDAADVMVPYGEDYMPYYTYAGGIAWDPKRFAAGKHPTTFPELWDAAAFPGWRGFRTRISETLDIALLADGVDPKQLYPLDVERGFAALEKIRPHVKTWIEQTPQTVALVQSGEVDFSYSYSGRVRAAQRDGTSIEFSWAQTLNALNYLTVLKGAPNRDAAMKLVAYTLDPQRAAAFSDLLGYTPTVSKALPLVSDETRKWLPDMSNPMNVVMDDLWWQQNFADLQKRYSEWLLTA
ncbi:MAG: ABC transporter substrate-binding protein [Planctomycetes bacterium]|nr:ABC transporter substrate-binding protein [Planctomycetota bacterium]